MDCSLHGNGNYAGNESYIWLEQSLCVSPYTRVVTTVLNIQRKEKMQEFGQLNCDSGYY